MIFGRIQRLNAWLDERMREWWNKHSPEEPELVTEPTERDLEYVDEDEFVAAVDAVDRVTPRRLILTETELLEVSDWLDDAGWGTGIERYPLDSIEHLDSTEIVYERLQIHMNGGNSEDWACPHTLQFAELIKEHW